MKKSLIALAVLAASASVFAQVKITGNLEGGYVQTNNVNGAKDANSSGFGINKSQINFNAEEDLGNNMKFVGQLGLQGADRSGANNTIANPNSSVTGADSFLNLVTQAGTVSLSSTADGSYLADPSSISGVAGYDFQSNNASKNGMYGYATANTAVSYSMDAGPINVSVTHNQAKAPAIGTGIIGNTDGQQNNLYSLTYKVGGFSANAGYRTYDSQQTMNFAPAVYPLAKNQWRAQAGYDFGVAKVGAGISTTRYVQDIIPQTQTWLVGVAVPVGPLTLGAEATRQTSMGGSPAQLGAQAPTGRQFGVAYTANYALSKQTSLKAAYARWQQTNTTAYNTSEVSVLLSHSF